MSIGATGSFDCIVGSSQGPRQMYLDRRINLSPMPWRGCDSQARERTTTYPGAAPIALMNKVNLYLFL